jgi:enamine deaminase RidA (YjgF/YER057c/UK114 family)
VVIDEGKGTTGAETEQVMPALKADLTWSQLYTKAMHKDLVAISTAVSKTKPTTSGPKMKKDAEKLRDQLKSANQTVDQLCDHAGLRPAPIKK